MLIREFFKGSLFTDEILTDGQEQNMTVLSGALELVFSP